MVRAWARACKGYRELDSSRVPARHMSLEVVYCAARGLRCLSLVFFVHLIHDLERPLRFLKREQPLTVEAAGVAAGGAGLVARLLPPPHDHPPLHSLVSVLDVTPEPQPLFCRLSFHHCCAVTPEPQPLFCPHGRWARLLQPQTKGDLTSPYYKAWCLCRTSPPSLNHCFAACKAWGPFPHGPQRH